MSFCDHKNVVYGRASLMTFIIISILTIIYFFTVNTLDFQSHLTPFLQYTPPPFVPPCRTLAPLRVYMYDLPRRFNVGMIRRGDPDSMRVTAENLPPWPRSSGLRLQHSVEYWLMASLLFTNNGSENDVMEAVRVYDGDAADVYFVPFFSSLSFNVYGHNMTDPVTELDRQLQVDILEFLRKSKYWQRSGGRDHVIPMHHPNAFRFLREQVNASILIVADFGRYAKNMSNLRKDVVAPYVHVVDSYTNDDDSHLFKSRTTLLFFRGRTKRKDLGVAIFRRDLYTNDDDSHLFKSRTTLLFFRGRTKRKDEGVVRAKLAKILVDYEDVHYERSFASEETIKLSREGMRSSKFCLHPAGDTPSSCRLFDAIVSHCVPVIVSDQIELPFEDELDYSEFSIFFSTEEVLKPGYLVEELRKVPEERWVKMHNKLKNISHHYEFQYPPKREDGVNMLWRQIRHKIPASTLDAHRTRRLKIPDWWGRRR